MHLTLSCWRQAMLSPMSKAMKAAMAETVSIALHVRSFRAAR